MGGNNARKLLAINVRVMRLMRGWSQEELAEAAGLHRSYIGGVERAQRNVGLDALEKLAAAFEATIPDLLAEPDAATLGEHLLAHIRRAMGDEP